MVTISPIRTDPKQPKGKPGKKPNRSKKRRGGSILWRILLAFLLVVGVSFSVMVSSLTDLVSDYLYTQRIRQDSLSVEKLATTYAPLFQSAASDALLEEMASSGGEMGGRLILLDRDGKVQYDTFGRLFGVRLQLPEVLSVLTGGKTSAYGIHALSGSETALTVNDATHVAYCAAQVTGTTGPLGVLLFVSPVEEMLASLSAVEAQMVSVFLWIALVAMVAAVFFSRILTKPIATLTKTIQKMGKGDLSVRVPEKGSGELRKLAESYNTMATQLEAFDKSRNQFVSNASHELKTPLTTMKILLENLIYQPDMPKELQMEFMADMNHEIDRLTGLVTDLLTLTQMDNNATALKLEKTDLCQLTQDALHRLQPMAEKRNQTLTAELEENLFAMVDVTKMGQVLYNLAENGVKYTPEGGNIHLTLNREGGEAVWQVSDNGVGIP